MRPSIDGRLAVIADPGEAFDLLRFLEVVEDLLLLDAVEDRRGDLEAERLGRDAEVRFEHLADVHTRRHAERVQADVDRRAVREERHVFFRHDPGDDALVAVTAGHLVTDRELALRGDVDLDLLDDAGIDVVAALDLVHRALVLEFELGELVLKLADDLADLVADRRRIDLDVIVDAGQLAQQGLGDLAVGRDDDFAGLGVDHVERNLLAEQDVGERFGELLVQLFLLLLVLLLDLLRLPLRFGGRELHAGDFLARSKPSRP